MSADVNGLAEREIEEGERKQLLKKNSSEAKGLSIATGGMVEKRAYMPILVFLLLLFSQ